MCWVIVLIHKNVLKKQSKYILGHIWSFPVLKNLIRGEILKDKQKNLHIPNWYYSLVLLLFELQSNYLIKSHECLVVNSAWLSTLDIRARTLISHTDIKYLMPIYLLSFRLDKIWYPLILKYFSQYFLMEELDYMKFLMII